MLKEFKKFAMKGNVVELAIAVIIGASFGKIVTSLVNDVVMPPIGLLLGGIDFSNLVATIKPSSISNTGEVLPAVTINYGIFINTVIDFLIVAIVIFMSVKAISMLKKKEEKKTEEKIGPTEVDLLIEIRDSLKK